MDKAELLITLYDKITLLCRRVVSEVLNYGSHKKILSKAGGHVEYGFDRKLEKEIRRLISSFSRRHNLGAYAVIESTRLIISGDPVVVGLIDPIDGSRELASASLTWPAYKTLVGRGPQSATVVSLGIVPQQKALSVKLNDFKLYGIFDHRTKEDYLIIRVSKDHLVPLRSARKISKVGFSQSNRNSPSAIVLGFQGFPCWYLSKTARKIINKLTLAGLGISIESIAPTSLALIDSLAKQNAYLDFRASLVRFGEGKGATLKIYDVSALPAFYHVFGKNLFLFNGITPWDVPVWKAKLEPSDLNIFASPQNYADIVFKEDWFFPLLSS